MSLKTAPFTVPVQCQLRERNVILEYIDEEPEEEAPADSDFHSDEEENDSDFHSDEEENDEQLDDNYNDEGTEDGEDD
eukprot:gene3131-3332_t